MVWFLQFFPLVIWLHELNFPVQSGGQCWLATEREALIFLARCVVILCGEMWFFCWRLFHLFTTAAAALKTAESSSFIPDITLAAPWAFSQSSYPEQLESFGCSLLLEVYQTVKSERPVLHIGRPRRSNISCNIGFFTTVSISQSLPSAGLKLTWNTSKNDIISNHLYSIVDRLREQGFERRYASRYNLGKNSDSSENCKAQHKIFHLSSHDKICLWCKYNLKEILKFSVLKCFTFTFLHSCHALAMSVMTLLVFYFCWGNDFCG